MLHVNKYNYKSWSEVYPNGVHFDNFPIFNKWKNYFDDLKERNLFQKIENVLNEEIRQGYDIYPYPRLVFNAFNACDIDKVKVVIIGMDPYPNADIVNNQGEEIITKASHVALDIDLNEEITKKVIAIAKEKNKPIYGLPGNLSVILNNKDLLREMECFVCNDIEAAKIFAVEIELGDVAKITAELTKFAKCHNIKAMVVTMGEKGAVYFCRGMEQAQYHSVQPVEMVDSTGAGDAFFSGTISALVQGKSIDVAVEYGSKVAAHTIQSLESTCCGFIKD